MVYLYIFAFIATVFGTWRAWRRLRFFLHIFQLEGYKTDEFARWLANRPFDVVLRRSHVVGVLVLSLGYVANQWLFTYWPVLLALVLWPIAFASSRRYRNERQKKPLALTPRMKRLISASAALALLPILCGGVFGATMGPKKGFLVWLGGLLLADLLGPVWVIFAAFLIRPVELSIQRGFKIKARRRLAKRPDLKIVGITGSYGKTSVKFIVAEILRQRYNVLATPGSYNTPMGVCLVINRDLRREHQGLILEMGVRKRGDIRELCEIATPDLAVVTTIGMAHLATMKSIEAIAEEKGKLVEFVKPGGDVILNADDPYVVEMAARATGRVWRVSTEGNPNADITAHDIRYGPGGTSFNVRDDRSHEVEIRTLLLGKHNVLNILLGVATGRAMGLRLRQMRPALGRLQPIEHRLHIRREGPVTIIDDAFNANPVGARNAVEILGQFRSGRRIIVTPGMIELGERHREENRLLGKHIAANADLALLVGAEQTRPIWEGLTAAGFPDSAIIVVPSLFAAQDFLRSYLQPGDVVLYENDLPDQFNEF